MDEIPLLSQQEPQQQATAPPNIKQQSISPSSQFGVPRGLKNGVNAIPPLPNGNHNTNGINGNGLNGVKRKRGSLNGIDHSSPTSPGAMDDDNAEHEKKRQPGVKRACNECRQQKLRCTVIQDPFTPCNRCTRLKLVCKIESNFKRVGKRSKHAEMEKEIERLRRCLQAAQDAGFILPDDDDTTGNPSPAAPFAPFIHNRKESAVSDEAVSSLLNLKNGNKQFQQLKFTYELEDVKLTEDDARALFVEYFQYYHQFLPFLDGKQLPEYYKAQHPLLFWSIIAVAARRWSDKSLLTSLADPLTKLLWTTIGEVPSNYHVVKALCLLCTWPLPISSSSADPTHILCGVMMKVATMIGLHRPNNMQDFSRVALDLDQDQLHDRVETWAVCNIVAQSVGTGYGQPASTIYDWTLAVLDSDNSPLKLSMELEFRVVIERFCDKVSKEMYSNLRDPRGIAGDTHRAMLLRLFRRDFTELEARIMSRKPGPIIKLHLAAASLHLRLAGFFDSSTTPNYLDDLMALYRSTEAFIKQVLETDKVTSPNDTPDRGMLSHCSNFIQQMLVVAGFTLLKLLKSFFIRVVDAHTSRQMFNRTIEAIRHTSVAPNDLQSRLAELMVQMWNGTQDPDGAPSPDDNTPLPIDDSLQLKVRCRHSMSLVFDTIWKWREEFQAKGRGNLDIKSPTHLNSISGSNTPMPGMDGLCPPTATAGLGFMNGMIPPAITTSLPNPHALMEAMAYSQPLYDSFDPQNWMLDGLVDFPFNYQLNALDGA